MARGSYFYRPGGFGDRFLNSDTFATLQRELNRVFEELDVPNRTAQPAAGGGPAPAAGSLSIDLSETPAELKVCADLPGVAESDIDVSLDEDVLTIRGQRHAERRGDKENMHVLERSVGTFTRSVRLPVAVDPEKVSARFEHGVLTVTLPKLKPADRTRKIQVQTVGGGSAQNVSGLTGASAAAGGGEGRSFTQGDGGQGASPSTGVGETPSTDTENAAKPGGAVHGYNE
jgi:HSP20 family protein